MKVNIIGAGRIGKTLGRIIVNHQAATIGTVYNTCAHTNTAALNFIGQGCGSTDFSNITPADITLICTTDDTIESTCLALLKNNAIKEHSIVMHVSGVKSSDVLGAATKLQCKLASAHPMKSFADPELAANTFNGCYCALEGNDEALQVIQPLLQSLGARTFTINKNKKSIYHAAGVFSSNYLVTLYQTSLECLLDAEVNQTTAEEIILSLMQGTLENLSQLRNAKQALTGPIKRGDANTVNDHITQLPEPHKSLYKALGEKSLGLTNHNEPLQKQLGDLLSK